MSKEPLINQSHKSKSYDSYTYYSNDGDSPPSKKNVQEPGDGLRIQVDQYSDVLEHQNSDLEPRPSGNDQQNAESEIIEAELTPEDVLQCCVNSCMSWQSPLTVIHMLSNMIEGMFFCTLFPVLFASNQLEGFKLYNLELQAKEKHPHQYYKGDLMEFSKLFLIPCILCFELFKYLGYQQTFVYLMKQQKNDKDDFQKPGGISFKTKAALTYLNCLIGVAVYLCQSRSAQMNKANEQAFSSGKNKHMLFTIILTSSLIGLSIGVQRQLIFKYIDDIYQCVPVLNNGHYKQRNEVLNKLFVLVQNVGLLIGCCIVLFFAFQTGFGKALKQIMIIDGNIYGTEEELMKKKIELFKVITAQYNFHWWTAHLIFLTFITSSLIVHFQFEEINQEGRYYASMVYKDGLLVPNIPGVFDFELPNDKENMMQRVNQLQQLKARFKKFCKNDRSLIPIEHFYQMGLKVPDRNLIWSTKIQMAGFDLVHFAVMVSGYGIILEFIQKKDADMYGLALFGLPFSYIFFQAIMVFVFYYWIASNDKKSALRQGDTSAIVATLYGFLLLMLLVIDVSPLIHKKSLIFMAILISLGQKCTTYRAYLVLGLNPDFNYDIEFASFKFYLIVLGTIWGILFGVKRVWVYATFYVLLYELLAVFYYFGLSRMNVSGFFVDILRHTMPYDNSEAGDQVKFEHESFNAQKQIQIMIKDFIHEEQLYKDKDEDDETTNRSMISSARNLQQNDDQTEEIKEKVLHWWTITQGWGVLGQPDVAFKPNIATNLDTEEDSYRSDNFDLI